MIPKLLKRKIVYSLPFGFFPIVGSLMKKNKVQSILDLACGDGGPMLMINKNREYEVDGVDLFPKYLKLAKKSGAYRNLFKSDVRMFEPNQKYDMVFWSHNIEHLSKSDGEKLAKKIQKWGTKLVVILTPYGFCTTHIHDGNPLQDHKSGWYPKDFKKIGYKVKVKGFSTLLVKDTGNMWKETPAYWLAKKAVSPWFELPEPYLVCYKENGKKKS